MSNFKKILIILLLTIPILITTGYSAWIVINMQENDTPPDYNYEEIVKNAYDGQNKDYTGNGLGPDSKIEEELIDSDTYTFEYYDESTSQWIKGWPVDSGTYKVRVINKYDLNSNGVEITFVINKASQGVSVTQIDVIYDGQSHQIDENSITVDPGNKTDGAIIISGNIPRTDVGETVVTIKVLGNDNYNEYNSTVSIIVKAKDIASADVVAQVKTNYVYDGTKKEPSYADLLLTYNGMTLNDNNDYSDYEVTGYGENINATNGNKTASVIIKGIGNYTGTKTIYFDIAKADQTPTFDTSKIYDGLPANVIVNTNDSITATPVVTFYNQNHETISNPTDVALNGSKYYVKVTIQGNDNYNDYDSGYVEYTINPLSITDDSISFSSVADIKCTGSELALPKPIVTFNGNNLVETTNYTLSYYNSNNELVTKIINPGTYKVRITGTGNFNEYYDITFNVIKNKITDTTISMNSATYTSNQITPTATIIYNGKTLVEDKDYELSYGTIIDANSYEITINGIGIFEGTTTSTLVVSPANFANVSITIPELTYTASQMNVTPIVTFNGNQIDSNNYTFTITKDGNLSNVLNAGNYEINFTGTKNFTGTNNKPFEVKARNISEISFNIPTNTYNESNQNPVISASYGTNNITSSNYTVEHSYSEFVNAGTYKLTIKGKNNLSGTIEVDYVINKLAITGISLDNMSVRYDGNPHRLEISGTLPNGVEAVYTNNIQTDVGNYTVTVSFNDTTGNYIVPSTLTATLSITDKDDIKVELVPTTVIYNGSGQSVGINLYDSDGQLITDETLINSILANIVLSYDNNTEKPINVKYSGSNVTSYNVTATFNDNDSYNISFKDGSSQSVSLTINRYTLTELNVEEITEEFVYDGTKKEPEVIVKVDEVLLNSVDHYSVFYSNNTNVSDGVVIGVMGKGNYTGEIQLYYAIKPATPTVNTWPTIGVFVEGGTPTLSITSATLGDGTSGTFGFNSDVSTISYQGTAATCTGTTKVVFTPNSSNYTSVTQDIGYTMYAVAKIGTTYYGTIKKAVDSASSGNKVYVINSLMREVNGNNELIPIPVKESITIPNGVSVYITYDGTNYVDSEYASLPNNVYADSSTANIAKYRQTLINFTNGADFIINNGGSLYLGGQTHKIGVTGNYCEINLDSGSMIDCSGNFYCYGYVKENTNTSLNGSQDEYKDIYDNSYDAERMIRINSSGYLITIISIYSSFSDIASLKGYNEVGVFPFPKFDFPNLQTYTEVMSGATFDSKCFLVATSSQMNVNVNENMKVVGSTDGMFKLSSGNIAFEYCSTSNITTTSEGKTRVFINGEISQGYVSIKVYTETVTTSDKFIPLSYKFNIFINDGGSYSSSYKMKFLPGSKLKINKGGELVVDSDLIFYQGDQGTNIPSYSNKTDAILINNGTIVVTAKGKLGAFIQTEATDNSAKLDFSATTSKAAFTASSTEGTTAEGVARTSSGLFADDSAEGKSEYQFKYGTIVYSDASGKACWDGEKDTTYALNITIADNNFEKAIFSYEVYTSATSDGQNPVDLTSGDVDVAKSFDLVKGYYVKIVVKRHNGASFDDGTIHNSSTWYLVDKDLNLIITPNEGVKLTLRQQSASGAGYTNFFVYESPTQASGDFYLIDEFPKLSTSTTYVVKGWYYKVTYEVDGLAGAFVGTELDTANFKITPLNGTATTFKANTAYQASVQSDIYFPRKDKSTCIIEGTMVNMADGTQKPIEQLVAGDKVLVFNHETGKVEESVLVYNVHSEIGYDEYEVIRLYFSDGTSIGIHGEHYFFDLDLNKYVSINADNVHQFVNHRFFGISYNQDNGTYLDKIVTLESYTISKEYTRVFGPTSAYHLNYFAEGILNANGDNDPFLNIFEYDESMKYDEDQKQADIEKYGLFTYEDFKDYITEDIYNAYNGQYLKVAIGKGYTTFERILELIEKYLVNMGYGEDYKENSKMEE